MRVLLQPYRPQLHRLLQLRLLWCQRHLHPLLLLPKSRSVVSSCRRPVRVRRTRHRHRFPACRRAVPSSSVPVVLPVRVRVLVAHVRRMAAPVLGPAHVGPCIPRVPSPVDLRPAREVVLASVVPVDVLALAGPVPVSVDLALVAVA